MHKKVVCEFFCLTFFYYWIIMEWSSVRSDKECQKELWKIVDLWPFKFITLRCFEKFLPEIDSLSCITKLVKRNDEIHSKIQTVWGQICFKIPLIKSLQCVIMIGDKTPHTSFRSSPTGSARNEKRLNYF